MRRGRVPGASENEGRKGRVTHLIVRYPLELPQKSANEGDDHGNDERGQGEEGDVVESTCQEKEQVWGLLLGAWGLRTGAVGRSLPAEMPGPWGQMPDA